MGRGRPKVQHPQGTRGLAADELEHIGPAPGVPCALEEMSFAGRTIPLEQMNHRSSWQQPSNFRPTPANGMGFERLSGIFRGTEDPIRSFPCRGVDEVSATIIHRAPRHVYPSEGVDRFPNRMIRYAATVFIPHVSARSAWESPSGSAARVLPRRSMPRDTRAHPPRRVCRPVHRERGWMPRPPTSNTSWTAKTASHCGTASTRSTIAEMWCARSSRAARATSPA